MIKSLILEEKYRVQQELSQKFANIKKYLENAKKSVTEVSKKYNVTFKYAK
jgi:hypothetical protein